MPDNFDDILGSSEEQTRDPLFRPRGRPSKKMAEEREEMLADMQNVERGATVEWFVHNFHMKRETVIERLKECPVKRKHPTRGWSYYDIKTAAGFLVEPAQQIAQIKAIKAQDLPERLRESFWNAKIKEMKFRVLAGELWPTESVMEVLSDTFQLISGKTKLWVDDLEEVSKLDDAQRRYLGTMVDDLIAEIRKSLIERAESRVTESYIAEMDS